MTYVRAQLCDRLQRQVARAYRQWRHQTSRHDLATTSCSRRHQPSGHPAAVPEAAGDSGRRRSVQFCSQPDIRIREPPCPRWPTVGRLGLRQTRSQLSRHNGSRRARRAAAGLRWSTGPGRRHRADGTIRTADTTIRSSGQRMRLFGHRQLRHQTLRTSTAAAGSCGHRDSGSGWTADSGTVRGSAASDTGRGRLAVQAYGTARTWTSPTVRRKRCRALD